MTDRNSNPTKRLVAMALTASSLLGPAIANSLSQTAEDAHKVEWSTEDLPNGHVGVKVTNTSKVAVTAVLVYGERARDKHTLRSFKGFDAVIDPFRNKPLQTGQSYSFNFFGAQPDPTTLTSRSVTVKAALFADGGAWGDKSSVDQLLSVRRTAYRCENEALAAMMEAKLHPSDNGSLVGKLQEIEQSERQKSPAIDDKIVVGQIFSSIIESVANAQPPSSKTLSTVSSAPRSTNIDAAIKQLQPRLASFEAAGWTPST